MLTWLKQVFSRPDPKRASNMRALPIMRARYDAATTNSDNYRHWANADGLSADSAASPEVRRILRNRSRYEVANNSYARGIVDLLAIRKDHSKPSVAGLNRGDLFEIVMIQIKGGSSPRPTAQDIARLHKVAKHYKAKTIILAEWRCGEKLDLFVLKGTRWSPTHPREIFG